MKRFLLWSAAVFIGLVAVVALAFIFTPWPRVAIVTYLFSRGDRASAAALRKHVPPGIVTRRNLAYGGGPDEVFDLYYREGTSSPGPAIVWVHGGGFVAGSKEGVANYMKILAAHGYTVVAVEYSKGYGTTYPKPVEQVNAALAFLVRNAADLNIDPATIILAGDSAGAQISCQVALIIADPAYAEAIGIPPHLKIDQLKAMILVSGVYDFSALNAEGYFGWFGKAVLWAYSGVKNFREDEQLRMTSIPKYVTKRFPPTFISSGNGDPLAPQAVTLAHKLRQLGVRVEALFFPADREPALPHEYQFNLDDPAGRKALDRMLAFLDSVLENSKSRQAFHDRS
jgi:acetyl esterase/lipase